MANTSNIIDKPRKEGAEDLLGVDKYTDALIQFIETCQMPTTLAIQGEWGSGKTSLLNQIRHRLCESALNTQELNIKRPFYGIWVNTWQYSLMKSKDEALIAIIGGLTNEILSILKSKHESKQSFTIPPSTSTRLDFETKRLSVPKIKNLKFDAHRKFDGEIKTCTISKTPMGKYFISLHSFVIKKISIYYLKT
jgi:hypothetical protein